MSYTQLAGHERYQISCLMKAGLNTTEIADQLKRSKSTISREVRRNRGQRGYRPKQANGFAERRRARKITSGISEETWQWVQQLIQAKWRPEQVSHWLARAHN